MSFISDSLASLHLGQPRTFGGLTMVPLLGGSPDEPGHVTLDEAISCSSAGVSEISESGSVPELAFENRGERPVFLLDGEEVIGAKQNRILNLSILVAAQSKLKIPVSCVEQGRWSWRSRHFQSSDSMLFMRARRDKMRDVSYSLRSTGAPVSDQGGVWAHVHAMSAELRTDSRTAAMHDAFRTADAQLHDYAGRLACEPGQCGAAFLIGGRVAGLDVFSHQKTAARLHPKLVRSYALECIALGLPEAAAGEVEATTREFLARVGSAEAGRFKAVGLGEDVRLEGQGLVGAALVHDDALVHVAAYSA